MATSKDKFNSISEELFTQIFSSKHHDLSAMDITTADKGGIEESYPICLESLDSFIDKQLKECYTQHPESNNTSVGRLGHDRVNWDLCTNVGSLIIDADRLGLSSHSSFSSIKANCCVFKGKWMYEVMLGSKGVMQLGWATINCKFSQEKGVGDTENSYAFDGNRVRKWNVNTFKYGQAWQIGDVIGVCIDCDEGLVEFYRNGCQLGIAFKDIKIGPAIAYYPAASLAFNEQCVANFGRTPFRYPVKNYRPLEITPYEQIAKGTLLSNWLFNLLLAPWAPKSATVTNYLIANQILSRLAPMLQSSAFVTEECFVRRLLQVSQEQIHLLLDNMWALLEDPQMNPFLEHLMKSLIDGYRYSNVERMEGAEPPLNFTHQKRYLQTVLAIIRHPYTRIRLLKDILFDKVKFALLMDVKQFDDETLGTDIFPNMTIYGVLGEGEALGSLSNGYVEDKVSQLETLQRLILHEFIFTDDVSRKIFVAKLDSFVKEAATLNGRSAFTPAMSPLNLCPSGVILSFFHRLTSLIRQQYQSHINVIPVSFFLDTNCVGEDVTRIGGVMSHLQKQYHQELSQFSSISSSSAPAQSSPLHPSTSSNQNLVNDQILASSSMESSNSNRMYTTPAIPISGHLQHIYLIIDLLLKMYVVAAHKQLGKLTSLRDTLQEYQQAIDDLQEIDTLEPMINSSSPSESTSRGESHARSEPGLKSNHEQNFLEPGKQPPSTYTDAIEVHQSVDTTNKVLQEKLLCLARQCTWLNSAQLTAAKLSDILWLLKLNLNTLEHASSSGSLFAFVPDIYLEGCLNLCYAARFHFNISKFDTGGGDQGMETESCKSQRQQVHIKSEYDMLLNKFARFIASHFNDERVANAEIKDNLAQALASLVSNPETLKALEQIDHESQMKMIKSLTAPYENRAWAQSNWILLRFWKGCGFAYRYQVPPNMMNKMGNPHNISKDSTSLNYLKPCPSKRLQETLTEYLLSEHDNAVQFVTSLLSQLNWSFSEFIGMLQEIQNAANRPEKVFIDSRQLKICTTCYDLTLALLRVLEMICNITPNLITFASANEMLLSQLMSMVCQVLNRITVRTGCFEFVTQLDIPGLESVAHFPILAAIAGILVTLCHPPATSSTTPEALSDDERKKYDSQEAAIKALVSDASFVPKSLYFLIGRDEDYIDDVEMKDASQPQRRLSAPATVTDSPNPMSPSSSPAVPNIPPELLSPPANNPPPPPGIPPALLSAAGFPGYPSPASTLSNASPSSAAASQSASHSVKPSIHFDLREFQEVSREEVAQLEKTIEHINNAYKLLQEEQNDENIDEDEICTICYASPKLAIFVPCKHESCKSCISLHFLRHAECFFCKATIEHVVFKDSREILYPKSSPPKS